MIRTAVFKLRTTVRDRSLFRIALRRWHYGFSQSLERARSREHSLLHCLEQWTSPDGEHSRIVVNGADLKTAVLPHIPYLPHLSGSCRIGLIGAVEESLASWLGLYAGWVNGGRKGPKPGFPTVAPGSIQEAEERWETALAASGEAGVATEAELVAWETGDLTRRHVEQGVQDREDAWRAEVMRASRMRLLPLQFAACGAGTPQYGMQHAGMIRREDGRIFALLSLFPGKTKKGKPVCRQAKALERAGNREESGELYGMTDTPERHAEIQARAARKAERHGLTVPEPAPYQPVAFQPGPGHLTCVMQPLEFGHGHEQNFLDRGLPKAAELVERDGEWYLHVAYELPDHEPWPLTGAVLAVRRGISTLAAWVVVGPDGKERERGRLEGRDLARLVTEVNRVRAVRQQKGKTTAGDHRLSRVVEHHLYSAARQLREVACQHGAKIVMLADPQAHTPQPFLRYKHWSELHEHLCQLCEEAGLPVPLERKLFGSPATCSRCGWDAAQPVRFEDVPAGHCGGCRASRLDEYHLARLLALDTLLREPGQKGTLGSLIRACRLKNAQ